MQRRMELAKNSVSNGKKRNFNANNVSAGREYIEAYVPFIHYAERVYEAATAPAEGHYISR